MRGRMDCFGVSDLGRRRTSNEDQFLIADLNKSMRVHQTSMPVIDELVQGGSQGKLLLVADGKGRTDAGELASKLAVASLTDYVLNTMRWYFRLEEGLREEDFCDDLKNAIQVCQQRIQTDIETNPRHQDMGTTLTLAYVIWPRAYVLHVGHSRCYLYHDSALHQVTTDHTLATESKPNESADSTHRTRLRNVVWNLIGGESKELAPEVHKLELHIGDVLLLCTDGLTSEVNNAAISETLALELPSEECCRRLVDAANLAGGSDNITTVIARFIDSETAYAAAEATATATAAAAVE